MRTRQDMSAEHLASKVSRLHKDAIFHAIRGASEINDQSQRLCSQYAVDDCLYHLRAAIGYLEQIGEVVTLLDSHASTDVH